MWPVHDFQRAFRENQPTVSEPFVGRLINVGLIGLAFQAWPLGNLVLGGLVWLYMSS